LHIARGLMRKSQHTQMRTMAGGGGSVAVSFCVFLWPLFYHQYLCLARGLLARVATAFVIVH
jgi:hypothetical protein